MRRPQPRKVTLQWVNVKSVKPAGARECHTITLVGHTKGKGGNAGAEVTVVLENVYSISCLLQKWGRAEVDRMKSALKRFKTRKSWMLEGWKEMEEAEANGFPEE